MAKPSCVARPICFAAMDGVSKPEKKVPNFTGDAAESTTTRCLGEVISPAEAADERGSSEEVESPEELDSSDEVES